MTSKDVRRLKVAAIIWAVWSVGVLTTYHHFTGFWWP